MKVYVAFTGDYEQRCVEGVYTTQKAAQRASLNGGCWSDWEEFEVEEGEPQGEVLWTYSMRLVPGELGPDDVREYTEIVEGPQPTRIVRGETVITITSTDEGATRAARARIVKAHNRPILARNAAARAQDLSDWAEFLETLDPKDPTYPQKIDAFWAARGGKP